MTITQNGTAASSTDPVTYLLPFPEYAGLLTSFEADSIYLRTGSFTDKSDTLTATVDKSGGIDVKGTGIYSCLSGTILSSEHFSASQTVTVDFIDVLGQLFVNFGITGNVCCFAAGTLIETEAGPRAVETLSVGDRLWAFGRTAPVTWVGERTIDPAGFADRSLVLPIRVRRNALSAGLPERDLVVSPDHAFWLDGRLIPARLLVNGVSILQEERREITYYHVALDRHDLILAEGVPVESYLDVAALTAGEGDAVVRELAIELPPALAAYQTHGYAPLCIDPAAVKPVWDALSARAGLAVAANDRLPNDGAPFSLLVDGRLLRPTPVRTENGVSVFGCELPVGARLVTLASAAASPWSVSPWLDDRRRLGVAVTSIAADGAALPLHCAALVSGWHGLETSTHAYRWTDGAATLVLSGASRRLEIGIVGVADTRRIAVAA